jgi:hypothetical protein
MSLIHRSAVFCSIAVLCACKVIPTNSLPAGDSIQVDHPEVFDNAQLQNSLDTLRGQLASLGIIDTGTLTGALGAVQGTSINQTNFSLQAIGRATPSVTRVVPSIAATTAQGPTDATTTTTAAATPSVPATATTPAVPTLPAVASDSIGLIEKQMQLESQLQGYQLLLGGSDFARYTISGQAKDRVVIGFPITIAPQDKNKYMAAEVEITYFPPNANQFAKYPSCEQLQFHPSTPPLEYRFSRGDQVNAKMACQEQEATPTIINILPAERSYNVVGVSSSSTSFGAAAIVGTVSLGASGGSSKQTQYLVAQQDTVALQGSGNARCETKPKTPGSNGASTSATAIDTSAEPSLSTDSDEVIWSDPDDTVHEQCVPGTRGVRFRWQFRPVLGEAFVRSGRRVTFVQLAIPNVRRPYPNYGGIVYIRKTWKPIDTDKGVVKDAPPANPDLPPAFTVKNVLGHTFISSEVSKISEADLGSGSVLVSLQGTYLTGATIRIGGTILNTSSPGFIADYNSLQFVTTAQALAQSGAVLISSEGVESAINLSSVCKSWDPQGECALKAPNPNPNKLRILGVSVSPVSDSSSLVRVIVDRPSLKVGTYTYYHYQKNASGDVEEPLDGRVPDLCTATAVRASKLNASINHWPIVLNVGGKTYGFTDLPFQGIDYDTEHTYLSVVATNDSINASPEAQVMRLFGNPDDDSDWQAFIPPGRLTVAIDPQWVAGLDDKAKKDPAGPCKPGSTCRYMISGANLESLSPDLKPVTAGSCDGRAMLDGPSSYQSNARGLTVGACAKQIVLGYDTHMLTDVVEETPVEIDQRCPAIAPPAPAKPAELHFHGQIVLALNGISSTPIDPAKDALPPPGTVAPHFQLVRSVQQASESASSATVTVGVENLKDQTATVTVQYADIVTAKDGSGNELTVQAGNKVTVSQDTSITFQVRNYSAKGVNIQAEGKNGTISAGKLTFSSNFLIVKSAAGAGGGGSGAGSQAGNSGS